jgi:hypothetical protein
VTAPQHVADRPPDLPAADQRRSSEAEMAIPVEFQKTNELADNRRSDRLLLIYNVPPECDAIIVRRADNGRPGSGVYAS